MNTNEAITVMRQPRRFMTRTSWMDDKTSMRYYESCRPLLRRERRRGELVACLLHIDQPGLSKGLSACGRAFEHMIDDYIDVTDWIELTANDVKAWRDRLIATFPILFPDYWTKGPFGVQG